MFEINFSALNRIIFSSLPIDLEWASIGLIEAESCAGFENLKLVVFYIVIKCQ